MSLSSPGADPPVNLDGPTNLGPFSIIARLGAGRRTTAYVGRSAGGEPVVVRELHEDQDVEVFDAETKSVPPHDGALQVLRLPVGAIAHGPLAIGENLRTILDQVFEKKRPLDLDVALAIAMAIAGQLSRSGEKRAHGDLVPHHVIVGYDGAVHLLDPAGSAVRERSKATSRSSYRSPEHVRGEPIGPASDVFALGILLFELSTGVHLFNQPNPKEVEAAIMEGRLPRPREIIGDAYPIELQLVLRKLLRPVAAGRFADGASAKDALRLVAASRAELPAAEVGAWLKRAFPERHARWREWIGDRAGGPPEQAAPREPRARTASRLPTRLSAPPVVDDLFETKPPLEEPRPREESSPPPEHKAEAPTRVGLEPETPPMALGAAMTPTPQTDLDFLEMDAMLPRAARPFEMLPEVPRLHVAAHSPTPTPILELDPIEAGPAPTPLPVVMREGGDRASQVAPRALERGADSAPAADFLDALGSDWSKSIEPAPLPEDSKLRGLSPDDVDALLDALVPTPRPAKLPAPSKPSSAPGAKLPAPSRLPAPTPSRLPAPVRPGLPPAKERAPIAPSIASDLSLPSTFNIAHDLLDGELEEAPRTVRQPAPLLGESHDTIEESSVYDVLPEALVAEVLHASDSLPPAALPAPEDRLSLDGGEVLPAESFLDRPTPLDLETNHAVAARRAASRADTAPLPRFDTLPMQRLDALPRGDTMPMLRPDLGRSAREEVRPTPPDQAATLPGTEQIPIAAGALRARLGIPPATTAPTAAKPSFEIAPTDPRGRSAVALWSEPGALAQEAEPEAAQPEKKPSEAAIATQVVRERVVANDAPEPKAAPPAPRAAAPRKSEAPSAPPSPAPAKEAPKAQARVPTLVVRERLQPAQAPSTVSSVAIGEPMIPDESSSASLVIPIPDDELDRATRRRKLATLLLVLASVVLIVTVGSLVLLTLTGEEGEPSVIVEPSHEEPRAHPAPPPPLPLQPPAPPVHAGPKTSTRAEAQGVPPPGAAAAAVPSATASTAQTATQAAAELPPPVVSRIPLLVRPKGAKVFVDGEPYPLDGILEVGDFSVELRVSLAGYQDFRETIHPGHKGTINVLLKRKRR